MRVPRLDLCGQVLSRLGMLVSRASFYLHIPHADVCPSVINPHIYASGVHIDLPAEMIQAALDGRPVEPSASTSESTVNPGRGTRR